MKIKLEDRIRQLRNENETLNNIFPIFAMQSSYYYAVMAFLSEKAYLNWLYLKIKEDYQDKWAESGHDLNKVDVVSLVEYANKIAHIEDFEYEGYNLMRQLIIESFCELNKKREL